MKGWFSCVVARPLAVGLMILAFPACGIFLITNSGDKLIPNWYVSEVVINLGPKAYPSCGLSFNPSEFIKSGMQFIQSDEVVEKAAEAVIQQFKYVCSPYPKDQIPSLREECEKIRKSLTVTSYKNSYLISIKVSGTDDWETDVMARCIAWKAVDLREKKYAEWAQANREEHQGEEDYKQRQEEARKLVKEAALMYAELVRLAVKEGETDYDFDFYPPRSQKVKDAWDCYRTLKQQSVSSYYGASKRIEPTEIVQYIPDRRMISRDVVVIICMSISGLLSVSGVVLLSVAGVKRLVAKRKSKNAP